MGFGPLYELYLKTELEISKVVSAKAGIYCPSVKSL
jgi:hypothetical protein